MRYLFELASDQSCLESRDAATKSIHEREQVAKYQANSQTNSVNTTKTPETTPNAIAGNS